MTLWKGFTLIALKYRNHCQVHCTANKIISFTPTMDMERNNKASPLYAFAHLAGSMFPCDGLDIPHSTF